MLWQSVSSSKTLAGEIHIQGIHNSEGIDGSGNNDSKVPKQTALHCCRFRQQVGCCERTEESDWWGRPKTGSLTAVCHVTVSPAEERLLFTLNTECVKIHKQDIRHWLKKWKNKEINRTRNRTFGSPHIVLSASYSIGYVVHLSHAALLGCCSSWLATRAQRVPHHFVAVALLYFCYHRGQMLHENLQLQYHSTCPNHIHHGRYIQYVT